MMFPDPGWWITVVEIPVLAGLAGAIWRVRQDSAAAQAQLRDALERRSYQLREALAAFKLEVAKTYAAQSEMRDLEARLTAHLLRIEAKLDSTALKAEALGARSGE